MKKKNKIKIKLNGKSLTINENTNIEEFVKQYNIKLKNVAIERNKEILDKKKIKKIYLNNRDNIEVVHFIGGG